MHTDFWSIFAAGALLIEIIPALVVLTLAIETQKE